MTTSQVFEVIEFTLEEALCQPFCLTLKLANYRPSIDFKHRLNQPRLLTVWQAGRPVRLGRAWVLALLRALPIFAVLVIARQLVLDWMRPLHAWGYRTQDEVAAGLDMLRPPAFRLRPKSGSVFWRTARGRPVPESPG